MLIKKGGDLRYSDITPKSVYFNRRQFLAAAPAAFLATRTASAAKLANVGKSKFSTTEPVTDPKHVLSYNNFYEFGTSKNQPARNSQEFRTSPWTVSVEGDCAKPRKFSIDEIMRLAPLEERIYRLRCVEAWSVVVPWVGYSLSALLSQVEPTSKAKFVAFETYWDNRQMPLARPEIAGIQFPYVEGLRLDEAMHPLALLTVGMYGETLSPQNGAPVRLVVPWKYGFKSIKSIVKIKLTGNMPPTTWNISNAAEYGFYSNVNPNVDHPRWSQAREQRLPGFLKNHPTQMFNGYANEVASLYTGMDLKKNYYSSMLRRGWVKIVVFLLCLVPAIYLGWCFYQQDLTANPLEYITHFTGDWALRLLVATLAITPLRKLLQSPDLIRFRRMLGLFAFFYGSLHFLAYLWLDRLFDFRDLAKDIAKRPFITAGFAAFVMMLPLAITSTKGWIRRLSGRRWQLLHRLVYVAAIAAVVHYYWLVKSDVRQPLLYATLVGVLLLFRAASWIRSKALGARPAGRGLLPKVN